MRYVWDQYESYFGPESPLLPRLVMKICRGYLQRWDVRSAKRVDHFIANSDNIAAKIRKLYGREAKTIHPPVEFERFYVETNPASYCLIVTALVPYKRIDLAIDAFNCRKLPLKIVGDGPVKGPT